MTRVEQQGSLSNVPGSSYPHGSTKKTLTRTTLVSFYRTDGHLGGPDEFSSWTSGVPRIESGERQEETRREAVQDNPSLRIVRPPGEAPAVRRPGKPLTLEDKRALFKGVVVHSLDAGFLRYSRRQELLRIAEQLGIGEFEACLLIAEAQFHSDQIDPAEAGDLTGYDVTPIARKISISALVVSALIAAILVDLALIVWLL
jgi:hypothetical protein